MPNSYPADSDILAAITGSGAPIPSGFSASGLAAAAIDIWEKSTGYEPFLSSGVTTMRTYDPPGPNHQKMDGFSLLGGSRMLDLGAGAVSISQVNIGVGPGAPGTTMTLDEDYWPEPKNAPLENRPFERIRFRSPIFGPEASVQITGVFGFGLTVPDDAWLAIVQLGAATGFDLIMAGLAVSPSEWQEDKVRQAWNPAGMSAGGRLLRQSALRILNSYRRMGWLDEE